MADTACQFVPTLDPRMGGACVVLPQSDPCRSLGAAKCSSSPACRPIDRCVARPACQQQSAWGMC